MFTSFADLLRLDIALGIVASLAWAICLVMAVLRRRAFRQRADVWWVLAYLCLLAVGIGRLWTAALWLSSDPKSWMTMPIRESGSILWADLLVSVPLATAAIAAVLANRRRPDAFDV